MRPERVTASIGVTISVAQFESVRLDVGAEAALDDGEDASDAVADLYADLRGVLAAQATEVKAARSIARQTVKELANA